MNDRYYVFNHGRKRGPFSLDGLLNEIERGQAEYEDYCLRIGATSCEKICEVLDWEDEHLVSTAPRQLEDFAEPSLTPAIEAADWDAPDDGDEEGEVAETESEVIDREHEEEDEDYDQGETIIEGDVEDGCDPLPEEDEHDEFADDYLENCDDDPTPPDLSNDVTADIEYLDETDEQEDFSEDEEALAPTQSGPPRDSTTILYSGRPSLLSFPKSLLLIALSLGLGIWLREQYNWILFAGLSIALIIYIQAQYRRTRHQYFITPKQVEVIHGLILEDSREICIEDIGAIYIRQRGLQGLLGLATIEFAAVESPMPILVFCNVRSARRIKSLIRRLQDALE